MGSQSPGSLAPDQQVSRGHHVWIISWIGRSGSCQEVETVGKFAGMCAYVGGCRWGRGAERGRTRREARGKEETKEDI